MEIVRPCEYKKVDYYKSVFLAGPTPRKDKTLSWRPQALGVFKHLDFDGTIFCPEPEGLELFHGDYNAQIEWEEYHLRHADCIMFWVPREMKDMPGLTTNIEWGKWGGSGKAVFGAPKDAPSTRYMRYYADKYEVPQATSLVDTVKLVVDFLF